MTTSRPKRPARANSAAPENAFRPTQKTAPPARNFEPATERGRRSHELLLKAAEEEFGKKGYYEASIAEIVRRAGVAQGTFYVHFANKQEIFAELLRSINRLIRASSREASRDAKSFIEAERLGFQAFFDFVLERRNIYRLIWEAEFVDPELRREHYTTITGSWARRIAAVLNEKGERELDVEAIAYCLFGVAAFVSIRWPYWTREPIPDKVLESVLLFIQNGIGPYLKEASSETSDTP